VEAKRLSKLRAKRLSDYHSSETVVERARRGASGLNKRTTLATCLLKKRELKAALCISEKKGQKAARQRKSTMHNKKKLLTLDSRC
jgi:hypothetical protein